jgi:hypothetical protein
VQLFGNYFKEIRDEINQSGIANLIEIIPPLEHKKLWLIDGGRCFNSSA